MADVVEGARYYEGLNCTDAAELMAQVRAMLKNCEWELRHLLPDGSVDVDDSTRMLKERFRDGTIKHVNYREVIESFVYSSMTTGNLRFREVAREMATSQGW